MARRYFHDATRFVACRVKLADIVVLADYAGVVDKVKAGACRVLHEVDVDGERVGERVAA